MLGVNSNVNALLLLFIIFIIIYMMIIAVLLFVLYFLFIGLLWCFFSFIYYFFFIIINNKNNNNNYYYYYYFFIRFSLCDLLGRAEAKGAATSIFSVDVLRHAEFRIVKLAIEQAKTTQDLAKAFEILYNSVANDPDSAPETSHRRLHDKCNA